MHQLINYTIYTQDLQFDSINYSSHKLPPRHTAKAEVIHTSWNLHCWRNIIIRRDSKGWRSLPYRRMNVCISRCFGIFIRFRSSSRSQTFGGRFDFRETDCSYFESHLCNNKNKICEYLHNGERANHHAQPTSSPISKAYSLSLSLSYLHVHNPEEGLNTDGFCNCAAGIKISSKKSTDTLTPSLFELITLPFATSPTKGRKTTRRKQTTWVEEPAPGYRYGSPILIKS